MKSKAVIFINFKKSFGVTKFQGIKRKKQNICPKMWSLWQLLACACFFAEFAAVRWWAMTDRPTDAIRNSRQVQFIVISVSSIKALFPLPPLEHFFHSPRKHRERGCWTWQTLQQRSAFCVNALLSQQKVAALAHADPWHGLNCFVIHAKIFLLTISI